VFEIPKTMQAAVYRGVDNLRVEKVPVPEIRDGELLVKVAVCGICPTDVKKIQYGTVPPPRIFGHETAGTVVKVGKRVRGFRIGDRVALHHHVPCLKCHLCRHRAFAQCETYKRTGITAGFEPAGGGFAEYVRVMSFVLGGVVKIPARNTFEEGAMLEPVNTVLKAVKKLTLLRGDHVLVVGQGPIGLMFTRLLTLGGVKVIATDLFKERVQLARKFGAVAAFNPSSSGFNAEAKRLTRGYLFDAAVVTIPSDAAVVQAQELVRGGGEVLLFGHTRKGAGSLLDLSRICVDEKDLIGSYSADFSLQAEVARVVFGRKLDVRGLISHRFALSQTAEGVRLAAQPRADSLKLVISPKLKAN
jgi:L-iditol 2-dehydrogenase